MFIGDIYKSKLLKHVLTDYEYSLLDEVWDFINIFSKQFVFISDYRKNVINTVRKQYTPEEFLLYESIANKLFWNLRWLLFPLWFDESLTESKYEEFIKNNYGNNNKIPSSLLLCESNKFKDERELDNLIKNSTVYNSLYYRSFINKLILIDRTNNILHTKEFEGSSDIFSKNYFNLLTMTILFDKSKYEKIMKNPFKIKYDDDIQLSKYYYQYDYGFPNLNYCTYDFSNKEQKLDRIKKLYFSEKPKKTKYWFRILY